MAKLGVALTTGRTGDEGAAAAAADAVSGPVDAVGAAAGAAPAAAAKPAEDGAADAGGRSRKPAALKPQAFKSLVGKGHPEFSSNRQQVKSKPFLFLSSALASRLDGLFSLPCCTPLCSTGPTTRCLQHLMLCSHTERSSANTSVCGSPATSCAAKVQRRCPSTLLGVFMSSCVIYMSLYLPSDLIC